MEQKVKHMTPAALAYFVRKNKIVTEEWIGNGKEIVNIPKVFFRNKVKYEITKFDIRNNKVEYKQIN